MRNIAKSAISKAIREAITEWENWMSGLVIKD